MKTYAMTADEVEEKYGIDLITAETLRSGMIEVTRQMHESLVAGAFSNAVREAMDCGVCIHLVGDEGSEMVATTEGCTQFAFTHQHMVNMMVSEYGLENLGPGDTIFTNDPWRGGIHLPDMNFVRPVYWEGKPVFILSDASHFIDTGGAVAGGFNQKARVYFEEGVRIPPTLIVSNDVPVRSAVNLMIENTRTPVHTLGDLRALIGTLRVGELRLRALLEKYGVEKVIAAAKYTLDLAERRMRKAIAEMPDGTWEAEEFMDDDALGTDPVKLKVAFTVKGDQAEIDFSGTERQSLGATTTMWIEATRCLIGPKLILDPIHPMNAGAARPFHILLPAGSVVCGLPPKSQCQHLEVATKVGSLMVRVLSRALPEKSIAPDAGVSGVFVIQGIDPRPAKKGMPWGLVLMGGESWGGTQKGDGISFCMTPVFNCHECVVEYMEKESPMINWEMGITIDSAGVGKFRGGYSPFYTFEALGNAEITPIIDRAKIIPSGEAGGGAGMSTYGTYINKGPNGEILNWNGIVPADSLQPHFGIFNEKRGFDMEGGTFGLNCILQTCKPTAFPLEPGKIVRYQSACAGGFGNPLERDPELVRKDVWNELLSIDFAAMAYGIVIDPKSLEVNVEASKKKRAELLKLQANGKWEPPLAYPRNWPVSLSDFSDRVSHDSTTTSPY
ncbi:MAG: hydantoinase B/oxoprolinase family protein [Betaproteobacteria bacterium]|nr:hydantoinase B/oxoprolinase family protein [Betaproteobacteria bacterium]